MVEAESTVLPADFDRAFDLLESTSTDSIVNEKNGIVDLTVVQQTIDDAASRIASLVDDDIFASLVSAVEAEAEAAAEADKPGAVEALEIERLEDEEVEEGEEQDSATVEEHTEYRVITKPIYCSRVEQRYELPLNMGGFKNEIVIVTDGKLELDQLVDYTETQREKFVKPGSESGLTKTVLLALVSDVRRGGPVNYRVVTRTSYKKELCLQLDTGSSLFWVRSVREADDEARKRDPLYDPEESETHEDWGHKVYEYTYAADKVKVQLHYDDFQFLSLEAKRLLFGAAPSYGLESRTLEPNTHGIIGLSYGPEPEPRLGIHHHTHEASKGSKTPPAYPNLIMHLAEQSAIDEPVVTFLGPRAVSAATEQSDGVTWRERGFLAIGTLRREYLAEDPVWCPKLSVPDRAIGYSLPKPQIHWYIKLDAVRVNGETMFTNQVALLDTGTAYIVTSTSNFEKLKTKMGGVSLGRDTDCQFAFGGEGGFKLDSIDFVLDKKPFALHPEDLTLGPAPVEKMRKEYKVTEEHELLSAVRNSMFISSITRLRQGSTPEKLWVLGGIFLDNFATIFDYGKKAVGFAHVSHDDPSNFAQ